LMSMGHLSERVSLERPLQFHRRIYSAVRERDPVEARRAMQEHILDSRSLLSQQAEIRQKKSSRSV